MSQPGGTEWEGDWEETDSSIHIYKYGSDSIVTLYYTGVSEPTTFIYELYTYVNIDTSLFYLIKILRIYTRMLHVYIVFSMRFYSYTLYICSTNTLHTARQDIRKPGWDQLTQGVSFSTFQCTAVSRYRPGPQNRDHQRFCPNF